MKTFKDLVFKPYYEGVESTMMFKNGYGVSVLRTERSKGGDKGLYELMVIGSDGHIIFDTPVTPDVLGWLTEEQVTVEMYTIQKFRVKN